MTVRSKALVTLSLTATLIGLLAVFIGRQESGFPKAVYKDMDYVFQQDEAWLFTWIGKDREIARIFVRLPDGKTFVLANLPENVASALTGGDAAGQSLFDPSAKFYSNHGSRFVYSGPNLSSVKLSSYSDETSQGFPAFTLSTTEEGPFAAMPRTREELIELFGEPNKWGRYHPPATP